MKDKKEFCIRLRGDFACFTRPEMKVERVSYEVITPSAARNIFQAIFWKPAIKWHIRRIEVHNPIRKTSVRRNEVSSVMNLKSGPIDVNSKRTQRTAYILKDVCYRIFAEMEFIPLECRSKEQQKQCKHPEAETPEKYHDIFERRASRGQCFTQPYLGCREFSCSFEFEPNAEYQEGIDDTRSLGYMLFDLDFESNPKAPNPLFFNAYMEHGVITVPHIEEDKEKILR
ncbi:type I-C CRISPR-associated protein Cas5c [Porphyromonas circumdentaria]|nr:type I-C CRISPR-associated protein Cas5c [Porphyromonas circumdentaria]MBB6276184.1 CRISPR-associated protein Cas5d [Porphyromonas circumdentaria]MDO4722329.1 type I-C CRISPR-associated protein Cas5c [Porphyromonas circumdentaria]